jgi:hypothetical protein
MKKLYTSDKYKLRQRRIYRLFKKRKSSRTKRKRQNTIREAERIVKKDILPKIIAPSDFRLLQNTEDCLSFFSDLRNKDNLTHIVGRPYVEMSLKHVTQIDYCTISFLNAIIDDFIFKRILLRTNFPRDEHCRQFLLDSGFTNKLYNEKGRPFPKNKNSELLFFEKGAQRLTKDDNLRISRAAANIMKHLTGNDGYCQSIRTMLLEICGNSIEWSGTENKQWLLGLKYEEDKVIMTVTDVGKGIVKTLYKKFGQNFSDFVTRKTNDNVLFGAFERKYGSSSQKINRNKGLPCIKSNFDNKNIVELKVFTNNVILHFDDKTKSRTIERGNAWMKGTLYRWVVNKDCIINRCDHENDYC